MLITEASLQEAVRSHMAGSYGEIMPEYTNQLHMFLEYPQLAKNTKKVRTLFVFNTIVQFERI